jgi:hypothetical protein
MRFRTIAPRGGAFMLPLSTENRAGAGVAAGDEVEVAVELDVEPREVTVPGDLAAALAAETRQRRVEKAVEMLRGGRRQRGSGIGAGSRRGAPTAFRVILAR